MKSLLSAEFRFMFPSPVTKDTSGNRLSEDIKDPQGTLTKTVAFQYDVLGRLYRVNNPDSNYWEYSYDAMGNLLSSKDPKGNPLTYSYYDPLGRLEEVVEPGDIHTLYGYDSHDHLVSVTDGNGNTNNYVLDDMGRVYQEISPDTGTTPYQHDPVGNVIAKTDARGITVSYSYDELNRKTLVDFPTDTDILYTYDSCTNGKGKLCQVLDQTGTTSYTYSPNGELVQEDKIILGDSYAKGYQYDGNGNLHILTYPSGRTVTYLYDNADQVTSILTTAAGGAQQTVASSISYYPFGEVASLTYGNGLVRTATYNTQYQLTSINTSTVQDLVFVPNPNGNIQNILNNLDSSKDKTFVYDALNRLEGSTGPWGSLSWTYDAVGNRQTYTDSSGTTNYVYYPDTNRIQSQTGTSSVNYTYDPNGSIASEGTRSFIRNEHNRLTHVNDGAILGEYSYNAFGQRTTKTAGGSVTIFHHDPFGNLIAESLSDGNLVAEYIYLGKKPVAKLNGDSMAYIHTDHLNTPVLMTDMNLAVVWEIESRPFGEEPMTAGVQSLNLRFPGQYYDLETGLHYNYLRYYEAKLGRYIQSDPIGLQGGLNTYGYALQNPLYWIDPLGLTVTCIYVQATGQLTCTDDDTGQEVVDEVCYSGAPGAVNDPAQEDVPNVGPIPRGEYDIGPGVNNRGTGPMSLPLTPSANNNQFPQTRDRNTFLMHGDNPQENQTASEGCVICLRNARDTINNAGGGTLDVQ